ncbi:MAG: hypothetical protein N5P05_004574 [Chroococcopsis gigantea SAG 12.99]|jgi:choice-of-anchor C domain-containing protein|nr:hypothetical protein [Chroococcopsis gigantea SAG 12.99]
MKKKSSFFFLTSKSSLSLTALVLTLASYTGSAQAAAFQNGSFEVGTTPDTNFGYSTLHPGSTAITGWTVNLGTIDYISTFWTASNGERSVDLNGFDSGIISQTFDTVAGKTYKISFDLAGNPYTGFGPDVKTLQVTAPGFNQAYSFDITGKTPSNMGWQTQTFSFLANGSSSTLAFISTNSGSGGPALDNVSVVSVPEPLTILGSMTALAIGASFKRRLGKKA